MTKIEKLKLKIETLLLLVAVIYGVAFALRTWPFPSAGISLTEQNRIVNTKTLEETVLLKAKFSLNERSNLYISEVAPSCVVIESNKSCIMECPKVDELITQGQISGGDSFSWSCQVKNVPLDSCILVGIEIKGAASLPSWGNSRWWTTHISCPVGK